MWPHLQILLAVVVFQLSTVLISIHVGDFSVRHVIGGYDGITGTDKVRKCVRYAFCVQKICTLFRKVFHDVVHSNIRRQLPLKPRINQNIRMVCWWHSGGTSGAGGTVVQVMLVAQW